MATSPSYSAPSPVGTGQEDPPGLDGNDEGNNPFSENFDLRNTRFLHISLLERFDLPDDGTEEDVFNAAKSICQDIERVHLGPLAKGVIKARGDHCRNVVKDRAWEVKICQDILQMITECVFDGEQLQWLVLGGGCYQGGMSASAPHPWQVDTANDAVCVEEVAILPAGHPGFMESLKAAKLHYGCEEGLGPGYYYARRAQMETILSDSSCPRAPGVDHGASGEKRKDCPAE